MEILKFEGSSRSPLKQRKSFRVVLGITVMGVFAALGSTLAANITINSSQAVEFGQGLSAAAACDSSINVAPRSTFSNQADTAGVFMLSSIVFTNVDFSTCDNKEMVISTYDSGTATANYLGGITADSYTAVTILIGSDSASVVSPSSGESPTVTSSGTGAAGGFTINFGENALTEAGNVYKVTVESRGRS